MKFKGLPLNRRAIAAGLLSTALPFLVATAANAEAPKVVASIKPIHSLVSSIMAGVGEPTLIVKGAASPHTYTMRPSDAEAISNAAIIFWVGEPLEKFLDKPLATLGAKALSVQLIEAPGVERLKPRTGGTFDPDRDGDEAEAGSDEIDPHFWLDPENARAAAKEIALTLEKADPEHAAAYAANAQKLDAELVKLEEHIRTQLAPLGDKQFIVFHDAYHYFENRFGLKAAGSITVSPEVQPGAARIAEMEDKVRSLGAVCIYSEPEFEPKLVDTVAEGSNARKGVLDPEGGALTEGPDLYETLLLNLANDLDSCLSKE
jgi:zinc transport system substrate-binding protein